MSAWLVEAYEGSYANSQFTMPVPRDTRRAFERVKFASIKICVEYCRYEESAMLLYGNCRAVWRRLETRDTLPEQGTIDI